jgi:hypothetical protein
MGQFMANVTTVLQNRAHPSQQKFFHFLGTQNCNYCMLYSLFHILILNPVGIPAMYIQLELQLCQYCNVTLNQVGMPVES